MGSYIELARAFDEDNQISGEVDVGMKLLALSIPTAVSLGSYFLSASISLTLAGAEDANMLGCTTEVRHARRIVTGGTSATRQRAAFDKAREDGAEATSWSASKSFANDERRAMRAAETALLLDPESPEALVSVGIVHYLEGDGLEGMRYLEDAIELGPSNADAFSKISWIAQLMGRPRLAAQSAERANELDPLSVEARVNFALTRFIQGDAELALSTLRPENDLVLYWPTNQFYEGVVLYHIGRHSEAIEVLDGMSLSWAMYGPEATLALAHVASGDVDTASQILTEMEHAGAHPFLIGLVRASLGDIEAAFDEFDSIDNWTAEADWPVLCARYLFPEVLDPLRSDPRYDRMLRSIDRAWGLVM